MNSTTKKQKGLLERVVKYAYCAKGSINDYCAKCNRARCLCETKPLKRSFRLTYKDSNQQTRVVYIPRQRVPEVKTMLVNHARLKSTIEQLIELNIKIFKDSG